MRPWASDPWMQILGCVALVSAGLTAARYASGGLSLPSLPRPRGAPPSASREPGRWRVGPAGDAPSLAAALERARPGDEILLGPGRWRESVVVDKPVSIKGASREETILVSAAGTTVFVRAGLVSISGLTIEAPDSGAALSVSGGSVAVSQAALSGGTIGALIEGAGSVGSFRDVLFAKSGRAVAASGGARVESNGCRFVDNGESALCAIRGSEIADSGSTIENPGGSAVFAEDRSVIKLDRTTISGAKKDGAHLARRSVLVHNRGSVRGSAGAGFTVTQGSELYLSETTAAGSRRCGIEIYSGSAGFLDKAVVRENQCGVAFYGGGRLQSQGGDFTGNAQGPLMYADRSKSQIFLRGADNEPREFQELFR